jgi:hypothetical protein
VVEAGAPLPPEVRSAMRPVRGVAVDWRSATEMEEEDDAAPFDSPPGLGFDSDTVAAGILPAPGTLRGGGPALALSPSQNNTFRALNRAWDAGATVRFQPGVPTEEDPDSGGRYLVSGLGSGSVDALARELHLRARGAERSGTVLPRPRLGLFRPWQASMDEGWTRWLLERYGFELTSLRNVDVRNGQLRDRFDVIILASYGTRTIVEGHPEGSVPPRFAGGIGAEGVRALDAFVRGGGTLVCMNASSDFAIDALELPVRNVLAGLGSDRFSANGSILEVITDPSHPVMAGMPTRAKVFFSRSPAFTVTEDFQGVVLAKYRAEGSPLLSGFLEGEEHLRGYAAALDVHHGGGHVILLGFQPQWRGQPFGTFRVLFNAALFQGAHAGAASGKPDFWSPPPSEGPETGGRR